MQLALNYDGVLNLQKGDPELEALYYSTLRDTSATLVGCGLVSHWEIDMSVTLLQASKYINTIRFHHGFIK